MNQSKRALLRGHRLILSLSSGPLKLSRLIMIELFPPVPSRILCASCKMGAALACAVSAVLAITTGNVQAQGLTTQMLIGDAVDTTSLARYTDVDEAIKRFMN